MALVVMTGVLALVPGGRDRARAECLYVVAYVSRENAPPVYVHGPDGCVTETPWRQRVLLPTGWNQDGLPDGTPDGYFLDLRVPLPS